MQAPNHCNQVRPRPLSTVTLRVFARYRPLLAGYVHGRVEHELEKIRRRRPVPGAASLIRSATKRLNEREDGKNKWPYTRRHSVEVGFISFIIAKEAKRHEAFISKAAKEEGVSGPEGLDPEECFGGGYLHDVGKTFLPVELMKKELGTVLFSRRFLVGDAMTPIERGVLRKEHIRTGTEYMRLFGSNGQFTTFLNMAGLHHTMYNGLDSVVPSYPRLKQGREMPFHARIAKTADFLSAILPRYYRERNWVLSPSAAVVHALAIAGMELDPLTVACFLTGTHDISPKTAMRIIDEFKHPEGQAGISDQERLRAHIERKVRDGGELLDKVHVWNLKKVTEYEAEVECLSQRYGIPTLAEVGSPMSLSIKNKYADAA